MSIDQIVSEALSLPIRERALLASSLWESIDDPYSRSEERPDEEAIALALVREEELESGAVLPVTHAELMRHLRE